MLADGARVLRIADERSREPRQRRRLESLNDELGDTTPALERRAAELARSNGELEQFASIASHDLQEPLRKVRTFTQQLTVIEADRLSDKGRDYLQRANARRGADAEADRGPAASSRALPRTVGRSRRSTSTEVTHEVLEDLEAQVERGGATVHVGELPTINADALQMRQLMQNLISNALKFRRDGVTPEVSIDASCDWQTPRAHASATTGSASSRSTPAASSACSSGSTAAASIPGTGIGLALCRKIAERHGGTVIADSEPGVGSTFTVTLPVQRRDDVIVADRAELDDGLEDAGGGPCPA